MCIYICKCIYIYIYTHLIVMNQGDINLESFKSGFVGYLKYSILSKTERNMLTFISKRKTKSTDFILK